VFTSFLQSNLQTINDIGIQIIEPITFQLSNGSYKIRNTFAVNKFLPVNHAGASIFHSQAANIPIYLVNVPSAKK
jgi:hypothetical protein